MLCPNFQITSLSPSCSFSANIYTVLGGIRNISCCLVKMSGNICMPFGPVSHLIAYEEAQCSSSSGTWVWEVGSGGRSSPLSGPQARLGLSCTFARDTGREIGLWLFLERLSPSDFQAACPVSLSSLSLEGLCLISEREESCHNKIKYSAISIIRPGPWAHDGKTLVIQKPFCSQMD